MKIPGSRTPLELPTQTQSQTPNIPGISLHTAISRYLVSLQDQSKDPDIPILSLRVSSEELLGVLASFNTQDQDPDDPFVQDFQCAPRDFEISLHGSHVFPRLLTNHYITYLLPGVSRSEFRFRCPRTPLESQDGLCS